MSHSLPNRAVLRYSQQFLSSPLFELVLYKIIVRQTEYFIHTLIVRLQIELSESESLENLEAQ
jgi:hypothetical protein